MIEMFKALRQRAQDPARRTTAGRGGFPVPTGYYPNNPVGSHLPLVGSYTAPVEDYRTPTWGGKLTGGIDQHAYLYAAATWTAPEQGPRKTGTHDPLTDGPTQENLRWLKRYQRTMQGSTNTRFQDRPDYGPQQGGRRQDGVSWVYQPMAQPAMVPYTPALLDEDGEMPDTWRAVPPAPAHGWSARPAFAEQEKINRKSRAVPGMRNPHQDRLANSSYAGQSYSAQTRHVRNPAGSTGGAYAGVPGHGQGVPGGHV